MLGKYISQELDKGTMQESTCLPCTDIAAFADDRLDSANRKRVEGHLADCRECYRLYADTISAKLIVIGRADAPSSDRRVVQLLKYGVPVALAACLALLIFSGNFKSGSPDGTVPTEMKLPARSPAPAYEIRKKADEFKNMTGHSAK